MLKLSDYGAIGGARQFQMASINAGSNLLAFDLTAQGSTPITADDVGRDIAIATAGPLGGKLRTKITGLVSNCLVELADVAGSTALAAGATIGTDCSQALQAALDDAGKGSIEIDGSYLLLKPVALNSPEPTGLIGHGAGSRIYVAVGAGETALQFSNSQLLRFNGVTFVGTSKELNDAHRVLSLNYCNVLMEACAFFGLASISTPDGALVRCDHCDVMTRRNVFLGCTTSKSADNPVFNHQNFVGIDMRGDHFIDYGTIAGIYHSKIWLANAHSWVTIGDQAASVANAMGQGMVNLEGLRFDEGAFAGLVVWPTGRVQRMRIAGIQQNVCAASGAFGMYLRGIDRLDLIGCASGWVSSTAVHDAFVLDGCGTVVVDSHRADAQATSMTAKGVGFLQIKDSPTLVTRNLSAVTRYENWERGRLL